MSKLNQFDLYNESLASAVMSAPQKRPSTEQLASASAKRLTLSSRMAVVLSRHDSLLEELCDLERESAEARMRRLAECPVAALPHELISMIFYYLRDQQTLGRVSQVCRAFNICATPMLYRCPKFKRTFNWAQFIQTLTRQRNTRPLGSFVQLIDLSSSEVKSTNNDNNRNNNNNNNNVVKRVVPFYTPGATHTIELIVQNVDTAHSWISMGDELTLPADENDADLMSMFHSTGNAANGDGNVPTQNYWHPVHQIVQTGANNAAPSAASSWTAQHFSWLQANNGAANSNANVSNDDNDMDDDDDVAAALGVGTTGAGSAGSSSNAQAQAPLHHPFVQGHVQYFNWMNNINAHAAVHGNHTPMAQWTAFRPSWRAASQASGNTKALPRLQILTSSLLCLSKQCPNLLYISLANCPLTPDTLIKEIGEFLSTLQYIPQDYLTQIPITPLGAIKELVRKCPGIVSIDLRGCEWVNEEILAAICQLKGLRALDLSKCSKLASGLAKLWFCERGSTVVEDVKKNIWKGNNGNNTGN